MKVSLLVPIYGVEDYIARCAHSLFGQTYPDIEYIFVNDATPDRSIEILESVLDQYPHRRDRTRIIYNPHNLGLTGSRNAALDAATGDYVLCMDSDDYLDTTAIEVLAAAASETGADQVVFDYYEVHERWKYLRTAQIPADKAEYVRSLLLRRVPVQVWTRFARRELFTDNDIRGVQGLDYGEDFLLSPQLAYFSRKTVKLDRPLYYYVHRGTSLSNGLTPAKARHVVAIAELLETFFSSVPDAATYVPMMNGMKVLNKVAIIQAGNKQTWKYAESLYPDADYARADLTRAQRLILRLHRHRLWPLMSLYQRIAYIMRRMRSTPVK